MAKRLLLVPSALILLFLPLSSVAWIANSSTRQKLSSGYMFRAVSHFSSLRRPSATSTAAASTFRRSALVTRTMTSTTTDTTTSTRNTDFSLENLQARISEFVTQHGASCRLCLSIAGGGGHFLSTLAATSGASQVLLEGTINYDRESYRRYVERDLPSEAFKYCSALSAIYAAESALRRAMQLSAAADPAYGHHAVKYMNHSLGMACASALRSESSKSGRASRAYICAHKLEGGLLVEMQVQLAKGAANSESSSNSNSNSTTTTTTTRTRLEEDVVVSHCVLDCLEYTLDKGIVPLSPENGNVHERKWEYTTPQGDTVKTTVTKAAAQTPNQVIRQAVSDIVSGKDSAVLLLPNNRGEFLAVSGRTAGLPPQSLVFPGSFNPPHAGHVELVKKSLAASDCQTAWFELSLTNADKPSLEADQVVARLEHFWTLHMPAQWGVILSNAPLFSKKVDLLHPLQVTRSYAADKEQVLTFVIGTDTLVRLLDPKYYDSVPDMFRILQEMPCKFVVGGRLSQKTDQPEFVNGQAEVDALPTPELRAKFTLLQDFRVDISSTEIRKQLSQEDLTKSA